MCAEITYVPFSGNNVRGMRCFFLVASRYSPYLSCRKVATPRIVYARSDSVIQRLPNLFLAGVEASCIAGRDSSFSGGVEATCMAGSHCLVNSCIVFCMLQLTTRGVNFFAFRLLRFEAEFVHISI